MAAEAAKAQAERLERVRRAKGARDAAIAAGQAAAEDRRTLLQRLPREIQEHDERLHAASRSLEVEGATEQEEAASRRAETTREYARRLLPLFNALSPTDVRAVVASLAALDGASTAKVAAELVQRTLEGKVIIETSEVESVASNVHKLSGGAHSSGGRNYDADEDDYGGSNDDTGDDGFEEFDSEHPYSEYGSEYGEWNEDLEGVDDDEDGEWIHWGCDAVTVTKAMWLHTFKPDETEHSCKEHCMNHESCNSINFHKTNGECALWKADDPAVPELTYEGFQGWCTYSRQPARDPDADVADEPYDDTWEQEGVGSDVHGTADPDAEADGDATPDMPEPLVPASEVDPPADESPAVEPSEQDSPAPSLAEEQARLAALLHLPSVPDSEIAHVAVALASGSSYHWRLVTLLEEKGVERDVVSNIQSPSELPKHVRPEAQVLRDEKVKIEADRRPLADQLHKAKEEDSMDFGEQHEFFTLKGKCFEKDHQGETYKFCPYGESKQGYRSIGRWDGFHKQSDWHSKYRMMKFVGGDAGGCPEPRSLEVHIECGEQEEVWKVDEPQMCKYAMTFACPAACEE
mmetsp:Transcript_99928/g.172357  ORF Transcript_99928/g.172357 Transcript_99928/m.172357 type:complete len:577 (-) Transcript_99928:170-1900(-)